ncbi:MAG: hypothetical protein VX346_06505 [Planctomycetota bacterium]|nr:hypothetical protein [Planctomycetota bacterium]
MNRSPSLARWGPLLLAVALACTSTLTGAPPRQADKPYRVIFNCDGHSVFADANGDVAAYVDNVFAPLVDSHVDALFWNDGAGGNTANYDSRVLERTGRRSGNVDVTLDRWIREGNDPPEIIVREGHRRGIDVFYSLRVNDIHDSFLPNEFASFKAKHPEWLLGVAKIKAPGDRHVLTPEVPDDVYSSEFLSSLNFAIPEVRDLKVRTIRDVADRYDFDGIELDLMRFPRLFRAFLEFRNAAVLTDFVRTVRQTLRERGDQRGRPFKLAVRVDENLVACRLDGFDVRTWVDEGLIDLLIVGDYAFPEGRDVRDFDRLTRDAPVQLYVCVAHPNKMIGGKTFLQGDSSSVLRGLAANYWHNGADGVYLFNWFPHTKSYQRSLLRQVGDRQQLVSLDKIFPADCSEYGPGLTRKGPSSPRYHNWLFATLPVALHPVQQKESLTLIPVDVADRGDGAGTKPALRLWLEFKNLVPGDRVAFQINGHQLTPTDLPDNNGLLRLTLSSRQLKVGRNQVGVRLVERGQAADAPLLLTAVEIHVDYP